MDKNIFVELQYADDLFNKKMNKSRENYNIILKKLKNKNKTSDILETEKYCINKINSINYFKKLKEGNKEYFENLEEIDFNAKNNKGINLAHQCIKLGDTTILNIFFKKGLKINNVCNNYTLFEFACLEKDINVITFLINNGADLQKHLYFRKDTKKMDINLDDIDLLILLKILLFNAIKYKKKETKFDFLKKYINYETKIGINNYKIKHIIPGLDYLFEGKTSFSTYKQILEEEMEYSIRKSIFCPSNKIEILLINLIPFINYPFHISTQFILLNETKYIIKLFQKKDINNYKNLLFDYLNNNYIKKNILTLDTFGLIIYLIFKNK
jgi:hypothetical protein